MIAGFGRKLRAALVPRAGTGGLFALRIEPPVLTGKLLGVLCLGLLLLAWFLLTMGLEAHQRVISPTLLPSPGEVLASSMELLTERNLVASILATIKRVLLGFGLAVIVGVPLGFAAGSWRAVNSMLAPLVMFGRNIPIAALIPLTILWFGIDESQKVMFIFIATMPFIFSDAAAAVIDVHDRYVETAKTLGASDRQVVFKVLVPLALPNVYTSLRYLYGLAFGYIMLAELINAKHGLGHLLSTSQRRGKPEHILLILFIIALLAYGIDRLLVFFQRGLFPYRKDI